ncbi:restriction endonuclease subunit S [Acetivibrio saccincola]|uniref:EcoKI restriction-modification system protein HsdS n=1 Tax=Acetivibrio saccincola TaxID=1677857 RepID=A0A2K9E684_9FIRM|nr:restriction endonuclease subunit S [Acetivibrio saccincola]AUG58879.1 EcoKI restriction-modification system protein HsdS [Acetivibrio saccincola]
MDSKLDSKFFKIGDVFNVEKGLVQSSKNVEGQFDFITASAEWKTHNEYSHDCEALVFAAGAAGSLGRTHYVNGKFIASDLCFVLTPKDKLIDKVDLKFYFYYFNLNKDTIVKSTATGTSKLAINMRNFINYCIPLPSIEYQKLAREKIEEVEPRINELNLIFEKNLDYITRLRQSILQEAVQGKLVPQDPNDEPASVLLERIKEEKERLIKEGKIKKEKPLPPISEDEIPYELPEGWEWVRLGEIGETHTGTTPSTKHPEYFNGEIPFIKPADITDKGINYNNESLTLLGVNKGRLIPKDSVMMVCIGGSIGKCYYTDRDCSCNQQINAITAYGNMHGKFLYYFLSSPYFYKQVLARATGSATPIINKNKWSNILFPLPPLSEQKRIVEKVDQLMDLCDELEKNIEQSKKDSELLMQSVLQEVFKEA